MPLRESQLAYNRPKVLSAFIGVSVPNLAELRNPHVQHVDLANADSAKHRDFSCGEQIYEPGN